MPNEVQTNIVTGSKRPPSSLDEYSLYAILPFLIAPQCHPDFGNVKYDVILVDGRVRPQCAYEALLLLKRDGILIIHDFESSPNIYRPYYRIVARWYELLQTTMALAIFRIRPEKSGAEHYRNPGILPSWWTKTQNVTNISIRDRNKMLYEEPFDTPGPKPQPWTYWKADWKSLSRSPSFKPTLEWFSNK